MTCCRGSPQKQNFQEQSCHSGPDRLLQGDRPETSVMQNTLEAPITRWEALDGLYAKVARHLETLRTPTEVRDECGEPVGQDLETCRTHCMRLNTHGANDTRTQAGTFASCRTDPGPAIRPQT